ncbi:MAG: polyprenyl synthetase family protein [Bacteroidota bacterium]|nr:polyprenyl synthetase family protein [Bacteroidota bacterium]
MGANKEITVLRQAIEKKMKVLSKRDGFIYKPIEYILTAGGKRLRPIITLLAAESVGGNYRNILDAAVAVELLHTFTLVHDDIIDNADSRRGIKTIHKKWSTNTAILAGDMLAGIAYQSLLKTRCDKLAEIAKVFTNAFITVCEGQDLDIEYGKKDLISVGQYYEMINKKTACLISAAAEIGAIAGGGSKKQVSALRNYGTNLGIAFQINDDLLDIIGKADTLGKPIGKDILEGKKTILLLKALEFAEPGDLALLKQVANGQLIGCKKIESVKNIYHRLGVTDFAQKEIVKYTLKAKRNIAGLKSNQATGLLADLAEKIIHRNS